MSSALVAGCGQQGSPGAMPVCDKTFDFRGKSAPLGADAQLMSEARIAARAGDPLTFGELTDRAGWVHGGWDRVVTVPADTTAAELNTATGVADTCWSNVSASWEFDSSRRIRPGALLFLLGSTPLQVSSYSDGAGSRTLALSEHPMQVVFPQSVLVPKATSSYWGNDCLIVAQ